MSIISFGILDKKLFLILFFTILREINQIILSNAPDDYYNYYLHALEEDTGTIIAGIIINFLFKQKFKRTDKDKRSFKYLIVLFFLLVVKSGYERIYSYVIRDSYYRYYRILSTTNGVEIIFMSIATFLILNYKYYIHHMISMFIYCLLGISIDLILGNFSLIGYKYVYIYIIFIINEVLIYCYLKYMMDKLYYQLTEIILYHGIFALIIKIIIFSGEAIYEYNNDIEGIIHGIKTYFTEINAFIILFFQFIYLLVDGAFFYVFIILIMYYLRPNLMIISDEIIVYSEILFFEDNHNRFYTLIPFIFQILALLFYFEILELNLCNMNKNTAKNIQMREEEEAKLRHSVTSDIELDDQYYLKDDEFNINDESGNIPKEN